MWHSSRSYIKVVPVAHGEPFRDPLCWLFCGDHVIIFEFCSEMISTVNYSHAECFIASLFYSHSYTYWWTDGVLSYLPVPYDEGI